MRIRRRKIDRRYVDGFAEIAKKGLSIVTAPLRLLGRAGIRILRYCISAVQFLVMIESFHTATEWYRARVTLKEHLRNLNWSKELIDTTLKGGLKNLDISFGIQMIRRSVIMAITMATRMAANAVDRALS